MAQFPRRRQARDFCQWRFRDPNTCAYDGPAPSCDYTLQGPNGCSAKGRRNDGQWQTIMFGAYPGINSNGVRYA
jgi:phage-related protein